MGKCKWECEPHGQRCGTGGTGGTSGTSETGGTSGTGGTSETSGTSGTSGTGGTSETSGNVRAIVGQTCDKGEYIKHLLIKILIMNIETHYKELITQLVSACSYKKNLENSSFHY